MGCWFLFFLFSPEQDQVEEKQRYLANVRVFCSLAKNNWHYVYLVRKIASQYGMEFAQKLVTEAQFNWVFPVEILQQVKRRYILGDGSGLLVFSLCCFGVFLLLCGSWGTHHIESGCEDDLSLRSIEWNLLWQWFAMPACCLFVKAEMPQFMGGRGDSALSNSCLMSTVLTMGFSLCRYRTAGLIISIVTWHVARITESCVMLWGKP